MSRNVYDLGTLAIANGQQNSAVLAAYGNYQRARGIAIFGPAALTNTVTVGVSYDGGSTYNTLQSGGADVTIGADKAVMVDFQGWTHMRFESSGAEGAERVFGLRGIEER